MNRTLWAAAGAVVIATTAAVVGAQQGGGNGNVDGAIFTTTGDGTVVNENVRYGSKAEVYLNGGPQNHNANGLPDGYYYFQITNPAGSLLLSTEDIKCRVLVVANGRVAGVPDDDAGGYGDPSCYHSEGVFNPANGSTPVQMCAAGGVCPGALPGDPASFYDTDNPGGEYKAWITPVDKYDADNTVCTSNNRFGFCDSHSKTDNFKVRSGSSDLYADITVCKFNDVNGNGSQDDGEDFIEHWPITATFGDSVVSSQTADDGCVTFTFTGFANADAMQAVTLSETTFGDWTQTAPADGDYGAFSVSGGVITTTLHPGDEVTAPAFGNTNPYCDNCGIDTLVVTKTAFPTYNRSYTWTIEKSVDQSEIKTPAGADATFNYTVVVSHDSGTDGGWSASGKITVANPSANAVVASITDAVDNGGTCTVVGGDTVTLAPGSHQEFDYTCNYASLPLDGVNTATATADGVGTFTGTAAVKFSTVQPVVVNGTASLTDSLVGDLGTMSATDESPKSFTYSYTIPAPAGTCIAVDNTATFTTDGGATGSDSQGARVCGALPLEVSKTASPSFHSALDKAVAGPAQQQTSAATGTFNYTVTVTTSGWAVNGTISVYNPNDWQAVAVEIADTIDNGGTCTVSGGGSVDAGQTLTATYSCSYAGAPSLNAGVNTAVATWDAVAAFTATGSANGTAGYDFGALTVTDSFNGGAPVQLGTVNGTEASKTFTYSQTVSNAIGGSCVSYPNTATIVGGASDSETVTICNTATGGLTMGFWQNRNGQAIIKAANQAALGAYLDSFAPFQDRGTTTASTYITNVIKAANASGASMNAMLKGQMLATALDVYFSTPALGGNVINAPQPLGGVHINLASVCTDLTCAAYEDAGPAFGGAASMTVADLLAYASSQSNVGGSLWYANVKGIQELAKDTFDVINNKLAWIAP